MTDVNPYANTVVEDDEPAELTFDSIIELEDYERMLRRSFPERLSVIFLVSLLGLIAIAPLVLVVSVSIWRRDTTMLLPIIVFSLVFGSVAVAVYLYFRANRRAARSIEKYPDLLGTVRGRLAAAGMTLDDGERHHYISPQHLVGAVISPAGIRIPLTDDPYRFLAMTERMFDDYSTKAAKRLREHWFESARDPSGEIPSMWEEVNPPPDNAIRFRGPVTHQQSTRTSRSLMSLVSKLAGAVVLFVIAGLGNGFFDRWSDYLLVGYSVYALFSGIRSGWGYFKGATQQTWNQEGWISDQELAVCWSTAGIRSSLAEIVRVEDHGEAILLHSQTGGVYLLASNHFETEADWETVSMRCKATLPLTVSQ